LIGTAAKILFRAAAAEEEQQTDNIPTHGDTARNNSAHHGDKDNLTNGDAALYHLPPW